MLKLKTKLRWQNQKKGIIINACKYKHQTKGGSK